MGTIEGKIVEHSNAEGEAMDLIGALATLSVGLIALLLTAAIISLTLSAPGWLVGCLSGISSPRLKTMRRASFYWLAWVLFGVLPFAVSATGGPQAQAGQFLPTSLAIVLAAVGVVALNVNAYFIGYKQGLAVRARREVRKSLKDGFSLASARAHSEPDLLDENHPAVASGSTATSHPSSADAARPLDGDAPTRETPVRDAAPLDDEYPIARPHEG